MLMKQWVRRLFGDKSGRPLTRARRRPSAPLALEHLEDRLAPAINISIANTMAVEPAAGGTANAVFTVTRTGDTTPTVSVGYTTAAGTAQAGTDFTSETGTATFATGSATTTISVPIMGNGVYNNPDLNFTVQLTGVTAVTGSLGNDLPDFPIAASPATQTAPTGVAVGDLNGDGKLDIAVVNSTTGSVTVLLNTTPAGAATPTFTTQNIAIPGFVAGGVPSIAIGDFNGDGKPDLAVVSNYATGVVSVLLNTTATGAAAATFSTAVPFTTGAGPRSVTVADINGDGKPDLVTFDHGSATVSVLLNTTVTGAALPVFATAANFSSGTVYGGTVADLNGDGKPDIIGGTAGGAVALLNTTATGATTATFGTSSLVVAATNSEQVAAVDLNGDGKPDLAITSPGPGTVTVAFNTTATNATTLTFGTSVVVSGFNTPRGIALTDLNNDGKPDLVAANGGSTGLAVVLNTAATGATTPSFGAPVPFATGADPISLAVGDFNGDGRTDLVTANETDNTVSVLLNTPATITQATATGTITESNAQPTVSFGTETQTGATFSIPVTLSAASGVATTVPFTLGGTAGVSGVTVSPLTIAAGQTTAVITGTFTDGGFGGSGKTVTVTLGAPTNATVSGTNPTTFTEAASPTLASISPTSATAGDNATTITLTGTGFTAGSIVKDNGNNIATMFVSYTQLTAVIPAMFEVMPAAYNITVATPGQPTTAAQTFTVVPTPAISALSPAAGTAGDAATTVTLTGTGFVTGDTVDFNGMAVPTTFVSATMVTAVVPASDLTTAGTDPVTVVAPGGATSAPQTFTLAPTPTISALSPAAGTAGDAATTVTLTGTGFVTGDTVNFNGMAVPTTFVSATMVTAVVPASDLTTAGTDPVTVVAPGGATSAPQTFTLAPTPTINGGGLSPASGTAGDKATTVTLTGTGFVSGDTVDFNGMAVPTTFVSATMVTAVIPATDLTTAGTDPVTVVAPGGATSAPQTFTLAPTPAISALSPAAGTAGDKATTVTVTGTGFVTGDTVDFNGMAVPTTFVSATMVTAVVPASDLTTAGTDPVTVVAPGGATSAPQTFTVNPAPMVASLSPSSAPAGSPATTVTLTGTGFASGDTLDFNGVPVATTFVSATSLTAVFPAADLTTAGTDSVTVVAPGGSTSAPLTFTVANSTPVITSPAAVVFTAGAQRTFQVTATGTPAPTFAESGPLPAGVTFDPATGLFSGTPTAAEAGSYPVTVTARNGIGADAVQTLSLTVSGPAAAGAPATGLNGVLFFDYNANNVQDPQDTVLPGRPVFLDINGAGVFQAGDPTAVTDANGAYHFDTQTGTVRLLRDVQFSNETPTGPVGGGFGRLPAGGTAGGLDFGEVIASPAAPVNVNPSVFGPDGNPDANSAFVRGLYRSVLGRDPNASVTVAGKAGGELQYYLGLLQAGATRQQVAADFVTSTEHRVQQVQSYYQTLLHRGTDGASAFWVDEFLGGADEATVFRGIMGSAEFQAAHVSNLSFAQDLFADVLGRAGSAAELAGVQSGLAGGTSRDTAINDLLHSDESYQLAVTGFYAASLHRPPNDPLSNFWVSQLRGGVPLGAVEAGILGDPGSNEFYSDATASVKTAS